MDYKIVDRSHIERPYLESDEEIEQGMTKFLSCNQ